MISFNDIEKGLKLVIDKDPCEVIEASHLYKGRGQSVIQAKIRNLKNGSIVSRTFRPSEAFRTADIVKFNAKFLYKDKKGRYFFCRENNPKKRFGLEGFQIGDPSRFLKENEIVEAMVFEDEIIGISLPVKVLLRVIEAPPGIRGDRAQAGTKPVKIETGAEILTPLFVKEGDVIEVNTEKGEYTKRI